MYTPCSNCWYWIVKSPLLHLSTGLSSNWLLQKWLLSIIYLQILLIYLLIFFLTKLLEYISKQIFNIFAIVTNLSRKQSFPIFLLAQNEIIYGNHLCCVAPVCHHESWTTLGWSQTPVWHPSFSVASHCRWPLMLLPVTNKINYHTQHRVSTTQMDGVVRRQQLSSLESVCSYKLFNLIELWGCNSGPTVILVTVWY